VTPRGAIEKDGPGPAARSEGRHQFKVITGSIEEGARRAAVGRGASLGPEERVVKEVRDRLRRGRTVLTGRVAPGLGLYGEWGGRCVRGTPPARATRARAWEPTFGRVTRHDLVTRSLPVGKHPVAAKPGMGLAFSTSGHVIAAGCRRVRGREDPHSQERDSRPSS
jgi:hypothetical protein